MLLHMRARFFRHLELIVCTLFDTSMAESDFVIHHVQETSKLQILQTTAILGYHLFPYAY